MRPAKEFNNLVYSYFPGWFIIVVIFIRLLLSQETIVDLTKDLSENYQDSDRLTNQLLFSFITIHSSITKYKYVDIGRERGFGKRKLH